MVSITDACRGVTTYEYEHPSGQKTKETDPTGAVTARAYDARGTLMKLTDPAGAELNLEYNASNQLARMVDAIGGVWQWGYDGDGRLIGARILLVNGPSSSGRARV